ncbi:MAG TPA: membrane protein insertase YidC, partial [Thermoanaerobaculia bacterium]|nr:membrane protein insertase YidC [Thermoanaerobaculia bacterium]
APAAVTPPPPAAGPPLLATAEETVTVDAGLYRATLSNRGGVLRSLVLKKFRDATGQPLDLVRHGDGFPGFTLAPDPSDPFLARAGQALSVVEKAETDGAVTLRFRYREPDGTGLVRTYVFRSGYVATMTLEREGAPGQPVGVVLGPGIGNPSADELKSQYTRPGSAVALTTAGSVTRKANGELKEAAPVAPGLTAVGLEDNYFLAAFLPSPAQGASFRPQPVTPAAGPDGKAPAPLAENTVVLSGAGALSTDLYLGPKDIEVLEKIRPGMDRLIDYGWFAILVKPLLWSLKEIQGVVKNWGVAILVITVLIKLLLYPLTHKQLVSMKKMAALQPKMEAIRAKYSTKIKSDPQARLKMNEETMALYKQEGVNPAGGCLPLLLQMPILIAFYNLLAHSIELRHAPFMLWITDLSAKDPYYITPILMTLTMWLQQQMTPATGDPAMRRVMNIMPFAMGFFFKDMPSGLVLYWLMQNVLTIAQQLLLDRYTDLGPTSMKRGTVKPG